MVKALSDLRSTNAVPALIKAYADSELRADALAAITRTPDERAIDALLDGVSSKNPAERNAAHLAIRDMSGRVLKAVEARSDTLSNQALTELRQIYAGNAKAEGGPLFTKQIQNHSLDEYAAAAAKPSGDPVPADGNSSPKRAA